MKISKGKIIVGMSGGVDSSVAAWLLKQQGYDVIGLFMKNWDDDNKYCSSRQDWLDAASVADKIGIDIETVNFAAEYKDQVFSEFLREYAAGRTPNPDVFCNSEIKFKAFLNYAITLGADKIATGHYAQIRKIKKNKHLTKYQLVKAIDTNKDQSYFLYRLNQNQLAHSLFPLGKIEKGKVRKIASDIGLHNASKKDSTGICFIGERPFREFLSHYLHSTPGPILTPDGQKVGEHIGLSFYTLGQRKGLSIGGIKNLKTTNTTSKAWYVVRKDISHNTLYVAQGHDHPWLQTQHLTATQTHWIAGEPPAFHRYTAKTRYRQIESPCLLDFTNKNKINNDTFTLTFDSFQWAVTPGQSVVLYDDNVCLGGGIIT